MSSPRSDTARGMAAGITAFTLWGLLPGYWKALGWLTPGQVICLRALLTVPVVAGIMAVRGQFRKLLYSMIMKPRIAGLHALTAALLAGNWITFVWATHNGRITEASLGYFLTPLANVAMGALLLGERLSRGQWLALTFAIAGVAVQMIDAGKPPWVALALCVTFAFYGLLRKKASLDSLAGLTAESIVAIPAALLWLFLDPPQRLAAGAMEWSLLLVMGGLTAIPLLGFATAARLLPLSIVGILQFIAPSLQFIVGAVIYGEAVTMLRLGGFCLIWIGLIIFTADAWRRSRQPVAVQVPE
ncbi:MAG TPA: EamA family transporter RarD [Verrucomicrobiales bacterium]|nr:EamA family transporter RarD [Verrucomicrobiales bacterium]